MELDSEDDLKIALKKDRETMGHRYVEGICKIFVQFTLFMSLDMLGVGGKDEFLKNIQTLVP